MCEDNYGVTVLTFADRTQTGTLYRQRLSLKLVTLRGFFKNKVASSAAKIILQT